MKKPKASQRLTLIHKEDRQGEKQDKQGHAITPELAAYLAELEAEKQTASGGYSDYNKTYFERFRENGDEYNDKQD